MFFIFKIFYFLFLRLKNLFGNPKWIENKNCFQNSICEENWKHALQKNVLLRLAKTITKAQKTAVKGSFDLSRQVLLWRFYPPVLQCCNSSIAVVTKNGAINAHFSGVFGFFAAGRKPPPYEVRICINWLLEASYTRCY